jgi:hypothetical protein
MTWLLALAWSVVDLVMTPVVSFINYVAFPARRLSRTTDDTGPLRPAPSVCTCVNTAGSAPDGIDPNTRLPWVILQEITLSPVQSDLISPTHRPTTPRSVVAATVPKAPGWTERMSR